MAKMSPMAVLLLLACCALAQNTEEDVAAGENTEGPTKELKKTASQDLNNFFHSNLQPLSLSFLDRSQSLNRQPESEMMGEAPSFSEHPSRDMAGTTMGAVTQAIRDLKLTLADMDEKLDRVVQKVAPEGKKSIMRKGSEMFRGLFKGGFPNDSQPRLERGLGFSNDGGTQRGIGLSW